MNKNPGIPNLVTQIKNGADFHTAFASQIFRLDVKDITRDQRSLAKYRAMKAMTDLVSGEELENAKR